MSSLEITLQGASSSRTRSTHRRITLAAWLMAAFFMVVAGRLIQLALVDTDAAVRMQLTSEVDAARPTITDRNGLEMAMDVSVPSLYAEPRRIFDVEGTVTGLRSVLPELDATWLRERLTGDQGFVWVKRELTPQTQEQIMQLGLPGVDFITERRRYYPGGSEAAHILGSVNTDNQGTAGIEKGLDLEGLEALQTFGIARDNVLQPVALSIDMRVQHAMYGELQDALVRYKSIAAAGVLLNANSGEILGMVSLPDFDPNQPTSALLEGRFNRITAGNFELGSVVKTVAFAAALDAGAVQLTDRFDARFPIRFGRQTINDFRGQNRILTVPEIFRYSSNVGTIQIVQALGKDEYRSFFSRIGFDQPLRTELPEFTRPQVPPTFSEVVAATASFGHGFSIPPLHMARALAAFVNGGKLIAPTIYPRDEDAAAASAVQIISPQTSERLRYLLRYNATDGSGSRMNRIAMGYRVGGKTGTAEKVVNGRYGTGANLNVFVTAFPMEKPEYVMVILVDEAAPENAQSGNTAGWNAGEVSGRIITKVAPLLRIQPLPPGEAEVDLTPTELRR